MKRYEMRPCPNCGEVGLAEVSRPNHILHAILSLLTAGLWLVVWLIVMIGSGRVTKAAKCKSCGTRFI